ncbi:FAD:protein FMN transferase [Alkalibacter mobilis]|uniref:FAD:protein FMN transferase n=1 Tax=Alkalibacter mobilis TaxID=2787712 RepID=UPI00189F8D7E|nr:FAD:protein FMN transferase [Alkalibacter mobilis]MBF7097042.1 FAD:protein FMN transferase [Alkalibacter mobilis]
MKKRISIVLMIFLLAVFFISCSNTTKNEEQISKNDFLLDTVVSIKLYDVPQEDEILIDQSFKLISDLESILSVHKEGSDLYKLKMNAGKAPVEVSHYTMEVIKKSLEYSIKTDGKFDITAGPLIDLWAIDPPNGYLPTNEEIITAVSNIDFRNLIVDEINSTVYLAEEGMIANLGAIAKGYIADQVKSFLIENDVEHAIINLGGNVLLVGDKPDGSQFRIGVQDPDAARNTYIGVLVTSDTSVVSSGDYERYFEKDGVKYHHILDPETGYPANNHIRQVSIVSETSVDGDALSTTLFLLGLDKGIELINSMNGVEAIFVTDDNKIVVTEGLHDSFEFDETTYSDTYEIFYR